ncbi:MAG: glycosyltransferase [Propionicimonas sp.]|uniref:glycosyltransferase n=1 Tax=Propionicimonas sp. TaxID=1955623 RepID=UPI003D0C64BC
MSALPVPAADSAARPRTALVDVIIPVYNEEADLAASVLGLDAYLSDGFPYGYRIVIADNASTDGTWAVAQRLAARNRSVWAVHLDAKGRGRALRQAWLASDADVVAYMDVDLSTDLKALLPLVAPLVSGHSDVAIGTRLARGSRVARGPKREFISRSYNLLLRTALGATFTDAQCGFKAVRRDVAQQLLPLVEDNNWFFDTELLVLAERAGLRIHEVPVDWVDDPGSTVDIVATAQEDLRGIWRLLRGFAGRRIPLDRVRAELERPDLPSTEPGVPSGMLGQLLRFGAVGVASTLAYFALYLLLRPLGAQGANLVALLVTAVANTAANRRFTFGISGRDDALRHHLGGLAAFGVALALTSGSLQALATFAPGAGRLVEVVVLVAANAAATLLRFVSLRLLMHRRP